MILPVIKRLFSPLRYFRIRHTDDKSYNFSKSVKVWYDFYIPLFIAFAITITLFCYKIPFSFFAENGVVKQFSQMLSFLAGFYITALAAIASFNRKDLDNPTKGTPLKIYKGAINQKTGQPFGDHILTRREYLCMLFGYLAFMSINLFLVGVLSELFHPLVVELIYNHPFTRFVFLFTYLYLLSHIIVTTFIGIFYLSERIHQE